MNLIHFNAARREIELAVTVPEAKEYRDKALGISAYAKAARDKSMAHLVSEVKVRAERKCGELLRQSAERGERAVQSDRGRPSVKTSNGTTSFAPTLSDLGITRNQSSQWQKLATISSEAFESAIADAKKRLAVLTTAGLLKIAATNKEQAESDDADSRDNTTEERSAAKSRQQGPTDKPMSDEEHAAWDEAMKEAGRMISDFAEQQAANAQIAEQLGERFPIAHESAQAISFGDDIYDTVSGLVSAVKASTVTPRFDHKWPNLMNNLRYLVKHMEQLS